MKLNVKIFKLLSLIYCEGTATDFTISFVGERVEDESFEFLTEQWKQRHVRQSQYLLQIVKCGNASCCQPPRTNIHDIFKQQFLPPPIPIIRTSTGPKIGRVEDTDSHFLDLSSRIACASLLSHPMKCFDTYCPSSQPKIKGNSYTCEVCANYFVTKSALSSHKKIHTTADDVPFFDEEEDNHEADQCCIDDEIEVIDDLDKWFSPIFIEA